MSVILCHHFSRTRWSYETNTFNPILKSLIIHLAMGPILWCFRTQFDCKFLGVRSRTKSGGTGLYWERRSHKAAFLEHRDSGLESGVYRYDHITYHIITFHACGVVLLHLSCTSSSWKSHLIQLDKDTEYSGSSQGHQTQMWTIQRLTISIVDICHR